jgi:pimeloyl-ACP methyl ester carboxylesterase
MNDASEPLTIDGRTIDYQETGDGPAVLFLPGSFSTPAAWRALQAHLPPQYRILGTSLCGYGKTDETRTAKDHGIEHEVRVVEAVIRRAASPIHLVGHSFGGTVALATALSCDIDIRSIATFEANPLALLGEAARPALYDAVREVSSSFEVAHRAGKRDAAARIIDYWGGAGTFARLPHPAQDYCRTTAAANVLDWYTDFGFKARRADYARLTPPMLLVRGELANQAMIEMTDALAASVPDVRSAVVKGASHFLIISHARECALLLSDFLAEVAG